MKILVESQTMSKRLLPSPVGFIFATAGSSLKNERSRFRQEAEAGNEESQCNLGLMYANGWGGKRNQLEAIKWLKRSAEQGDTSAQHNLGVIYMDGLGVDKDLINAYAWLHLSASSGLHQPKRWRDIIEAILSSEQIADAQRRANKLKPLNDKRIKRSPIENPVILPDSYNELDTPMERSSNPFVEYPSLKVVAALTLGMAAFAKWSYIPLLIGALTLVVWVIVLLSLESADKRQSETRKALDKLRENQPEHIRLYYEKIDKGEITQSLSRLPRPTISANDPEAMMWAGLFMMLIGIPLCLLLIGIPMVIMGFFAMIWGGINIRKS